MNRFISVDDASEKLGVKRGTTHYYLRKLKIGTHRFPLDRKTYLAYSDFERIQAIKAQAVEGSGEKFVASDEQAVVIVR